MTKKRRLAVRAHHGVEAAEDLLGLAGLLDQDQQRRLEHRHPQAARQAVPGDVGDDHRQLVLREAQDVEVVAADRRARLEEGGELDPVAGRQVARQQALLELRASASSFSSELLLGRRGHQRLQVARHLVEGALEVAHLVAPPHRDADAEIPLPHGLGGPAQAVHRPREPDDHEHRHQRRRGVDVEQQEGHHEQGDPGEGVDLGGAGEEVAQHRARRAVQVGGHIVGHLAGRWRGRPGGRRSRPTRGAGSSQNARRARAP